jgi:hypothetical protein
MRNTHARSPGCTPLVVATQDVTSRDYELVIVGSGNGACALLAKYLACTKVRGGGARRCAWPALLFRFDTV